MAFEKYPMVPSCLVVFLYLVVSTFVVFVLIRGKTQRIRHLERRLEIADENAEKRVTLRTAELEKSLAKYKGLKGIIPI